jgi:biopolymer transport protein ExbB
MPEELQYYFESGGLVMWPLTIGLLVLWYTLGYRFATLRRMGYSRNVRLLLAEYDRKGNIRPKTWLHQMVIEAKQISGLELPHLRKHLDDLFWPCVHELSRFSTLIKIVIYAAPLLGLLGTVTGMIETFDALQTMSLFSQTGGIAGGISQALITTQFGLAIAIPGMLIYGVMEKRKQQLLYAFDQIKDIVCAEQNTRQKLAG